jgi:hypothetical protein
MCCCALASSESGASSGNLCTACTKENRHESDPRHALKKGAAKQRSMTDDPQDVLGKYYEVIIASTLNPTSQIPNPIP